MVSRMCGGNQVRSTTVRHGSGSVMVWGCMSAAGIGELQFIEGTMNTKMYCDILKQSITPSIQSLGCRELFQHDNDHCLAKEAEDKGNLWCILKRKVEECKVSKIHQFRDVVVVKDSSGNM